MEATVSEMANELEQLRAENESLKKQAEEKEEMRKYWYDEWYKQVEKHKEQVEVLQYILKTMEEK